MSCLTMNPAMTIIAGTGKYSVLEYNGNWIKLPKENIDVVASIADSRTEENDIASLFVNQSDANYIKDIINKLKSIEIIYSEETPAVHSLQSIQWAITNKCNLNCVHCCQDAGFTSTSEANTDEWDTQERNRIARLLCHIKSLQTISITGGEPLLCSDCKEISTYIRNNFKGKTILMTNSLMIDSDNIEWIIKNFDHISISIDGSCAELTEMVRGKDIFDLVLSKIKLLHDYKFDDISLSAILPDTYETVWEFHDLCEFHHVDPMVRSYSMSGRGALGYDCLMDRFDKFIERRGYKRKSKLEDDVISGINRCSAGITQLTIEPDGNIQPCAVLWDKTFTLGNIKEMNADEFSGLTRQTSMFDFKESRCSGCSYKRLCWHCYDEYIYFNKNEELFAERCASRTKRIESILWGD